jgi:CRISPR-associated protein Csm2
MENIVLDYKKDAELFNETAKQWALKINGTKSTQIRNFYDYVLDLCDKAGGKQESFADILPFVKMLNSKVNYAKERKVASIEFVEMIAVCVKQINNKEQLETFKLFFEAVIGFSKKSDNKGDRQ